MNDSDAFTNVDIVLYALFLSGGAKAKVFTETVALESFKLVPERFSWRKYPQFPDIEPTRKALMEARNQKKLISGRAGEVKGVKPSDGWIFSPDGVRWIEENKSRISLALNTSPKRVSRTDLSVKLNELETSTAYKKFLKYKDCTYIKPYEFTDFLNASLDTPPSILRDRIDKISALVAAGKNNRLLVFINECKKHFSKLLKL